MIALLLAGALLSACGGGDDAPPREQAAVQALLERAVPASTPPGALVAVRDASGQVTRYAAGLGAMDPAIPMRPEDRFRAGSVLKLMIATVVLQLAEEGKLSLATPLDRLLPAERTAGFRYRSAITLEHLLNHTSGLGDTASSEAHDADVLAHPERLRSEQEYLDMALLEDQRPPGEHAYANTNYILLGLAIERATGAGWRSQVRQRVLVRLGLADSALPEPADMEIAPPFAHGYQPLAGGALLDVSRISPSMAGAAGGHALVTSTADLARFAAALFGGELYRQPGTLAQMLRFVPAEPIGDLTYAYGLGVMRHQLPDGTVFLGHGGSTAGYSCAIVYDPIRRLTVVAARNAPDLEATYMEVAIPVARALQGPR